MRRSAVNICDDVCVCVCVLMLTCTCAYVRRAVRRLYLVSTSFVSRRRSSVRQHIDHILSIVSRRRAFFRLDFPPSLLLDAITPFM